jgi:hypothetical protein
MHEIRFDMLARRATRVLNRRSLLGLATAATLVIVMSPLPTFGKKDPHHDDSGGHHGGGGNGKKMGKNDKNCQKLAGTCLLQVSDYCAESYPFNQDDYAICLSLYGECCRIYKKCKTKEGEQCIRQVNSILLD